MSPKIGRKIHIIMMAFWAINLGAVWFIPESLRIPYLMLVSIYANFVGHWSGWSAERPTEIVDKDNKDQ